LAQGGYSIGHTPLLACFHSSPTPNRSSLTVILCERGVCRKQECLPGTLGASRRFREHFGGIVDWDAIWTPGANVATWIEFSQSVTLEGHDLEAGRYAIWMVPHSREPWEVVVVREWDTHHGVFPFDAEVFRTTVAPEQGEHMETLGFYFPVVGPYEATLRLHWGTTIVPLRIEVPR